MAKTIDWLYDRRGWLTCQHAQGFLESVGGSAAAVLDARKVRMGPADALALARRVDRVIAARGKKVVTLTPDETPDDALLAHLLGPSGNLRAPAAVVGRTLVVGFNEDVYREVLGAEPGRTPHPVAGIGRGGARRAKRGRRRTR